MCGPNPSRSFWLALFARSCRPARLSLSLVAPVALSTGAGAGPPAPAKKPAAKGSAAAARGNAPRPAESRKTELMATINGENVNRDELGKECWRLAPKCWKRDPQRR